MTQNSTTPSSWPFSGFVYLVFSPTLWPIPLTACVTSFIVTVVALYLSFYLLWPGGDLGWFSYTKGMLLAFGGSILVISCLWFIVLPLIFIRAYERLVRQIYIKRSVSIDEERVVESFKSSYGVFVSTLGWRLAWPCLATFFGVLFPPLGIALAFWGIGHISWIEAADTSLSLRGLRGSYRTAYFKTHRKDFLMTGASAGLLAFLLSCSIVGFLFFVPSVYSGAALWAARQSDEDLKQS